MHVRAKQLEAARQHRQQVVEVVRDAAGQLAKCIQALRVGERLLGPALP